MFKLGEIVYFDKYKLDTNYNDSINASIVNFLDIEKLKNRKFTIEEIWAFGNRSFVFYDDNLKNINFDFYDVKLKEIDGYFRTERFITLKEYRIRKLNKIESC